MQIIANANFQCQKSLSLFCPLQVVSVDSCSRKLTAAVFDMNETDQRSGDCFYFNKESFRTASTFSVCSSGLNCPHVEQAEISGWSLFAAFLSCVKLSEYWDVFMRLMWTLDVGEAEGMLGKRSLPVVMLMQECRGSSGFPAILENPSANSPILHHIDETDWDNWRLLSVLIHLLIIFFIKWYKIIIPPS